MSNCPLEQAAREALEYLEIPFETGDQTEESLDFYLHENGVHLEIKQFHSPRIAEQTSRAANVIVLQGREAVKLFFGLAGAHTPLVEAL
jgi:hypothetical protein